MKLMRRSLIVPLLLTVGAAAWASLAPTAERASVVVADDEPPPECPLCGGDPALHAKRLANIEVLRFELAFTSLMELR
ncbi:MAG: hypothetical protein HZA52_12725 [Planctomycetes bacterium]|nr:hypothetical protein [Planctomycetota bacterium]